MSQIHELIPKIMSEVGAIEKKRKNQQQNYAFRGIDDAYAAFQPLFARHGVFVVPAVLKSTREERETKSGAVLIYTTLEVKHTFFAGDGSCFDAVTVGEAMDTGDKSSNKAMSAAMKYALLEVFCVPTEGDNDTENHSHEPLPRREAPTTRFEDAKPPAGSPADKTPPAQPRESQTAFTGDWRNFRVPFGKNEGKQLGELGEKSLLWYHENFKVETEYNGHPKKPETIAKDRAFRAALDAAASELSQGDPSVPF